MHVKKEVKTLENNKEMKRLAKTASVLTIVNLISVVMSFLQQTVFANFFGTTPEADAYTIASQIPVVLFAIITTAVNTVIIPIYSKSLHSENNKEAAEFVNTFSTLLVLFTIGVVVLFEVFANGIVCILSPGLTDEVHELSVTLTRIIMPTVVVNQLLTINVGVMNSHKSFLLPALTSNILNTIIIISTITLAHRIGIYASVFGTLLGVLIQTVYSFLICRKWHRYRVSFSLRNGRVKEAFKMIGPIFMGIGMAEINRIVDQIVASFFVVGSISALSYASKLTSSVSTLLIAGVSTIVYPEMAECATKNDGKAMSRILQTALSFFLILLIPIMFGGFFLQKELISLIFQRGAFAEASVDLVAPLFVCYLIGLLFVSFRQVGSRLFYSFSDSKTPMFNSMIGVGVNIILNVWLGICYGAIGLAIATTISAVITGVLILRAAKKRVQEISYRETYVLALKTVLSGGTMLVALWGFRICMVQLIGLDIGLMIGKLVYCCLGILFGAIVYLVLLLLLKTKEIKTIFVSFKTRRKGEKNE